MTHYEHVRFAYWLCVRGYFDNQNEVIYYFENPEEWITRHGWLFDLYRPAGEVTEGGCGERGSSSGCTGLTSQVTWVGTLASPSVTSPVTSKPERPTSINHSNVPRDALAGLHADTFGGLDS